MDQAPTTSPKISNHFGSYFFTRILGTLAFLLSIINGLSRLFGSIFLNGLVAMSLFTWVVTLVIGILFLIFGLAILVNTVKIKNGSKNSKNLLLVGLLYLSYGLIVGVLGYFAIGVYFDVSLIIGILSLVAGFIGISNSELAAEEKKEFFSKILKLIILLVIILVLEASYYVYSTKQGGGFKEAAGDLGLEGKIVFQKYSSFQICTVDLSKPQAVDCFYKNRDGRDPYWGPDGKSVYFYKWTDAGNIDSVVYDMAAKNEQVISGEDFYKNNRSLRQLKHDKNPLNPSAALLESVISPDGTKMVYAFGSNTYLSDRDGKNQIMLTQYKDKYCDWPMWYSNEKIIVACRIQNNRFQSGIYLMNTDGTNLTLIVPVNDDSLTSLDLFR